MEVTAEALGLGRGGAQGCPDHRYHTLTGGGAARLGGVPGPEAGSVRPRVVAFAGDQVSYARRYHVSPCPQGSSEWLLEKWVPAPTTLGVGSLGRGAGICIWRKLPRFWNLFAKKREKITEKSERSLATGESLSIKVDSSMKVSLL